MPVLKNPKHEIFALEYAKGKSATEAAMLAGYSARSAASHAHRLVENGGIVARVAEINNKIVERTVWDAAKLIQRWGEIADAKACDFNKPRSEWTEAMERIACDVIELKERSHDGVQAGESKAWDTVGDGFRIPLAVKVKALELIGKTKAVDAFVQQKQGDVNLNIVVTAERARQIAGAQKRLSRVIDVEKATDG